MDRRTILFVLLVGAAFFGLNFYFSHQRDEKNRVEMARQQREDSARRSQLQEEVGQRTAKASDLPIVNLLDGGEEIAKGVQVQDSVITLAWATTLPKKVVVGDKELVLKTENTVIGGVAVYSPSDSKGLEMTTLPDVGTFDVQVITFPKQADPEIYLGEFEEGSLRFPLHQPNRNGLVLFKVDDDYLPFGFYESQGNVFVELQDLPLLSTVVKGAAKLAHQPVSKEQKYYILENPYLQVVFSNVGGAVSEINLPFESDSNKSSVVKQIGFDRDIDNDSKDNALFPLHPAYRSNSSDETAASVTGGYYPLLRRGLAGSTLTPEYYAFNIVSDYPEMAELIYEVKEFSDTKIVFEATQAHRKITKTYTLESGKNAVPYVLNLSIKLDGDTRGLYLTSGIPEVEIMSNNSVPQLQYRLSRKGKSDVQKMDLPKPGELITLGTTSPDWIVNSNGYLGVIMDPLGQLTSGIKVSAVPGETVPTRLTLIDPQYDIYPADKYPGYEILIPMPTKGGKMDFRFYAGPFEEDTLKTVDRLYTDQATGYNPDYISCRAFYGWFSFISEPFAKMLFLVMSFFYKLTSSWGISIILLTVFLRILLYPLNAWSIKSMRRMQLVSPEVQAIQARYKKEPKKAQVEVMNLYREKKVNPFMGCVPILIQIPFLIGMFDLLKSSFQLRGASFIPGWIDNLTAPDVLFRWERPIFFIGNEFHLLPVLLGVVMFIQQRISSPTQSSGAELTDQQRQQRTMGTIMTVVFTVMFYHFPSGLNLYWLSSMILGIVQQWGMNRYLTKHPEADKTVIEVKGKKVPPKKIK